MKHRSKVVLCTLSAVSLAGLGVLAGCASSAGDDTAGAADALRQLQPSEILGSISSGETRTVHYTPAPLYRAFSFSAKAGDQVEIWVRGVKGSDPKGYLLGSNFATLAQNDNDSASTKDAHIAYSLKTAGTYYAALREVDVDNDAADFTVSVSINTRATSCSGVPISFDDLARKIPPGKSSVTLGRFTGRLEKRECQELSGCTSFRPTSDLIPLWRNGTSPYYWQTSWRAGQDGDVALLAAGNSLSLVFRSDEDGSSFHTRLLSRCDVTKSVDGTVFINPEKCNVTGSNGDWESTGWDIAPAFPSNHTNIYGGYDDRHRVRMQTVSVTGSCFEFQTRESTPTSSGVRSEPTLYRWHGVASL